MVFDSAGRIQSSGRRNKRLKILIIAQYFPPQNAIASLRPYSWAKYWSRDKHDVSVLTIPKSPKPTDTSLSTIGFRVIEVPIPGAAYLQSVRGRKTHFNSNFSTVSYNGMSQEHAQPNTVFNLLLEKLQKRYGIFASCRMPDQLDLWCKVAFNAVKNQHWDLVVSTAWPYGVHCPAYRLKKSGIATHWIADWRDLWVDNHIYRGLPGFRFVERLMEKRWSQEADAITTVSKPLAEILRRKYGNKVHVIYNGFDPEDFENLPMERVFPTDDTFRIVYTGTIYTGKRDPAPLFKAVGSLLQNKLNPEGLRIIFCGSNSDVSDIARKYSVNNIVEYAGFLPREVALRMQRDADALLFLEYESENVQGILTGKLFEYLFAGPPIIGVGVSDNSSVGQLLKRTGRGICLGINSDIIAEELIRRISEKHASSQKKIMNFKSISEYSRKEQSEKMLRILT